MPKREPVSHRLADTIKALRHDRGMTQEDLAHAAGITPGSLSRIEGGKANPTWTTVERIAAALGLTLAELGELIDLAL